MASITTLFSFDGTHGAFPLAGLIADAAGDLFGTTQAGGGANNDGTVFEIVKTASGYANTPTVLFSFDGTHGAAPFAGLTADAAGNLFGTTSLGGANNGTVFEIVKTASGYASTPTVLFSFDGNHGALPLAGLIADAAGNLFGTTLVGGAHDAGTVFEIVKTASGYASTPTVLFSFDGTHGARPEAGLIADAAGNLFGTTSLGGANDAGTVFEIVKTASGYASTPTVLFSFDGTHGASHRSRPDRRCRRRLVRDDVRRWHEQPRHGVRDREDSVRICQHPHCAVQLRRYSRRPPPSTQFSLRVSHDSRLG